MTNGADEMTSRMLEALNALMLDMLAAIARKDYHVEVDRHRYSVPHALVGQVLEARVTATVVEILHRGQRVASHALNSRQGGFTTITTHMPAAHRAHMEWTPQRLIHWGQTIGPATAEAVTGLMAENKHPEHGARELHESSTGTTHQTVSRK